MSKKCQDKIRVRQHARNNSRGLEILENKLESEMCEEGGVDVDPKI